MSGGKNILNATSFYDEIAAQYNDNMTRQDARTRKLVREVFLKLVDQGNVLDFGAGTGMDLAWLVGNKSYDILALEPSTGMRDVAKSFVQQMANQARIRFINNDVDFRLWKKDQLPFREKLDGILANFAVFNHIKELDILFEKLTMVSNSGCIVVALVLDASFMSLYKNYSLGFAIKNMLNSRITVLNKHKDSIRETYLYSLRGIQKAAGKHFEIHSYFDIPSTEFSLVILRKP